MPGYLRSASNKTAQASQANTNSELMHSGLYTYEPTYVRPMSLGTELALAMQVPKKTLLQGLVVEHPPEPALT